MQITAILSLPFVVALASAASNSTSSDDSLSSLVAQLPPCAVSCLPNSAKSVGCGSEDFTCLCKTSHQDSFTKAMGTCMVLGGDCKDNDVSDTEKLAGEICTKATQNPSSTDTAKASSILASAVSASATASATSTANAAADKASLGFGVEMGMLGAVAMAAFAL